jgi:hypothetical protein
MQETFLVKLKDDANAKAMKRVVDFLRHNQAEIVLVLRNCLIAAFDQQLADVIRGFSYIERVGGVTFTKREPKLIRIPLKSKT